MESCQIEVTFDVPVEFTLHVEIVKATKEFANNDGDVLFSENTGFHLRRMNTLDTKRAGERTRSEHEPPEQYLYEKSWRSILSAM
jgi:hypothetical protein